jgi:hypothetical protein
MPSKTYFLFGIGVLFLFTLGILHYEVSGRLFGLWSLPDIKQHTEVLTGEGSALDFGYSPFFYAPFLLLSSLVPWWITYSLLMAFIGVSPCFAVMFTAKRLWKSEQAGINAALLVFMAGFPVYIAASGILASAIHLTLVVLALGFYVDNKRGSALVLLFLSGLFHYAGAFISLLLVISLYYPPIAILLLPLLVILPRRFYSLHNPVIFLLSQSGLTVLLFQILPAYFLAWRNRLKWPLHRISPVLLAFLLYVLGSPFDKNLRPLSFSVVFAALLLGESLKREERFMMFLWGILFSAAWLLSDLMTNYFIFKGSIL